MVQLTFKAKHFYFIAYHLKNASIQQYFSLISRIKTSLAGNSNLEADCIIQPTVSEIISIYKVLTVLPEGVANVFNTEMSDLLMAQVVAGMADEVAAGNGPDADGNVPSTAHWHIIAAALQALKSENAAKRNAIISEAVNFMSSI